MHIHHNKKNYEVEAKVEGMENLTGPCGTASTIRVLVIMPFQGFFKQREHSPVVDE